MRLLTLDSRLDAIAGKPAGMQVGDGVTALAGFTATGPRSLYVAYEELSDATTESILAYIGTYPLGTDYLALVTKQPPAQWYATTRRDTSAITYRDIGVGFGSGRHVMFAGITDGLTTLSASRDDGAPLTSAVSNPEIGFQPNPSLFGASYPDTRFILAVAYPAVHTDYQRTMIMRKLLSMSGA